LQNSPDVDNDITIGELRDRLANDGLSTTESTRDSYGTTQNTREKSVEDTLTDNEGFGGVELLGTGAGHTDGPALHHRVLGLLAVEFDLEQVLGDSVFALGCDLGDDTASSRR
jgi:hypothetical protein